MISGEGTESIDEGFYKNPRENWRSSTDGTRASLEIKCEQGTQVKFFIERLPFEFPRKGGNVLFDVIDQHGNIINLNLKAYEFSVFAKFINQII